MSNHPVIVRVKRRRDQEPTNSICIYEDTLNDEQPKNKRLNNIIKQFSNINTNDNENKSTNKLLLNRINTIKDLGVHSIINESTLNVINKETSIDNEINNENSYTYKSNRSLWIPKGKSLIKSQDNHNSYVVVDINQMIEPNHTNKQTIANNSNTNEQYILTNENNDINSNQSSLNKIKVYDPITRSMDEAIDKAWKLGDFNPLSQAIQRGASINFQRDIKSGGKTALMSAVKHLNIRMVKRLLDNNVFVYVYDQYNKNVFDILRESSIPINKQDIASDILILLNKAALKQHNQQDIQSINTIENDSLEYVYDIFCYNNNIIDSNKLDTPMIPIEGVHISENGYIDLIFDYNSDWSDLGDDEDPDSNDERFYGNDYPDDDEGDEIVKELQDEINQSDDDSNDDDKLTWRQKQYKSGNHNIGHVIHYNIPNDPITNYNNTKSLNQLWNNDSNPVDSDSDTESNNLLTFTSNSNEFNKWNGLPKNGIDLSDDEVDIYNDHYGIDELNKVKTMYNIRMTTEPVYNTTIAYDSELDDDSDHYMN